MARHDLAGALLAPRAIALVGASGDAAKNTARPLRYLRKHGFAGRILAINPTRDEVQGEKAYPSITAAPGPIDHAFIMVPAGAVADALRDCRDAGVTVATIYSDGFAEAGEEGRRRQREIADIARTGGPRLVGPNSMGIINTHAAMPLSVNAVLELPEITPGSLGVVSQSGTILGTLLSRGEARGIGFSKMVSVGNECDLGVGEIGNLLVDDPETSAILLFLETIRDATAMAAMARRAHAAGKPVIVYKLGRSEAGRALAVSHSGAITGPDAAADAFFRHHGMIRVDMLETLFEMPSLVAGQPPTAGRRVAVMSTTGGGAAVVADRLGLAGADLVPAPESLIARLGAMGVALTRSPVIDLTMAGTRGSVYGAALEELLQTPECDAVVAVVGSSGQFHPELAVEPIVAAAAAGKPLAVFIVPQAERSLDLLSRAGIAAFRTPEACADGVRAYLDHAPPRAAATASRDVSRAATVLAGAAGPVLDAARAAAVFAALGIPQAAARVVHGPGETPDIAYPVAAKVLSPDIAHKTEAGGVVLDIADAPALDIAVQNILDKAGAAHPGAAINGVLVQEMVTGLAEVVIGYRRDACVGPTVTVGVGGVLAEIYADMAVRLAPVDVASAHEMIAEVRGLAPIRGYRSLPEGDCEALAQAIAALSDLARIDDPVVIEAEINPLVVRAAGAGVAAVDGLLVRGD